MHLSQHALAVLTEQNVCVHANVPLVLFCFLTSCELFFSGFSSKVCLHATAGFDEVLTDKPAPACRRSDTHSSPGNGHVEAAVFCFVVHNVSRARDPQFERNCADECGCL